MLEVLDTAGQEEYTALRDEWLRDGEGFVLVYSISSRLSFSRVRRYCSHIQRAKDSCLPSQSCPDLPTGVVESRASVPIMLVGNKSDRITEREVSTQEGLALACELRCEFVETSAKNNANVEKSFIDLIRMLRFQRQETQRVISPASIKQRGIGITDLPKEPACCKRRGGENKCIML